MTDQTVVNIKRQHTPDFKVRVVEELFKRDETISQLCSQFSIHPTQARRWKDIAENALKNCFNQKSIDGQFKEKDQLIEELYRQVGQLTVELEWLKKKFGFSVKR